MVNFESIRWKNLLSYGNNWTEYKFTKGITRLTGRNGEGKSSLIDAFYFGLFGKTYRNIKLESLVNNINKSGLLVEIYFTSEDKGYVVRRGLKPNVFEIEKNGRLIPSDSKSKTYQQVLEKEILHFDQNIFNQTGIKSLTKDVRFLALFKNEKRVIIESLFNLESFTLMNSLLKSNILETDTIISDFQKEIKNVNNLLENELKNLTEFKRLHEHFRNEKEVKIKELEEIITKSKSNIKQLNDAIEKIEKYETLEPKLDKKVKTLKNELADKVKLKHTYDSLIKIIKNKKEQMEKVCGGCEKIKLFFEDESTKIEGIDYDLILKEIEEVSENIEKFDEKYQKAKKIVSSKKGVERRVKSEKDAIETSQVKIKEEKEKKIIKIDETEYKKLNKQKTESEKKFEKKNKEKEHLEAMKVLLADDGVKSFIIQRYQGTLNKILNTYMSKFDTREIINLDSEFNEIVLTRGKEKFSYFNYSEGQKKKIDLAILFAFLEFSKFKNRKSLTNVLILDEINTGLDPENENLLYNILTELYLRDGIEIITISHSIGIDSEKINTVYKCEIEKGFSKISLVEK